MKRGLGWIGMLAAMAGHMVACRSYDVVDRTTAHLKQPSSWAIQPIQPDCYDVDALHDECFGPPPARAGAALEGDPLVPRRPAEPPKPAAGAETPRTARPAHTRGDWWTQFRDEDLNLLVARALDESPQARLALARVAQARAIARRGRAGQYPRLDAEISVSRQRQVLAFPADAFGAVPGAPPQQIPETFEIGLYTAQLVATYEPDLFGRVGDEARAQEFEVEASRVGVAEANVMLAAEISDAWFELLEVRGRAALLRNQLESSRARLELVRELYEHGLAQSLEVHQQRREVATALARMATVEGAEQAVKSRISALVGVSFEELKVRERDVLPEPEPLPPMGVPAEAVMARPEVRAARQRLEAADRRVGTAIAGRLPSLRLQGSVGFGSREIERLFDHVIWSVAATLSQPIWHGGDIDGGVDQARAILDERVAEYRDAVVRAVAEVESSLAALNQTRAELEALHNEVQVAEETLIESERLYQQGLADFLSVVDAERGLHGAQLDLLRARRAWLGARVGLYRSLGGNVAGMAGGGAPRGPAGGPGG